MDEITEIPWRFIAKRSPEFVQWLVQRHGGLPSETVDKAAYEQYLDEYIKETSCR